MSDAVTPSAAPEVRTEPLGGSALSRALQAGTAPHEWMEASPASREAWRSRAESVRTAYAAGAWLQLLEPAFAASGRAAERLERVSRGAGVVVTTGQQPGLFGGPLYTLSKAISALALADELEDATGIPAAPVFWAATDDADFAEASYTIVSGTHGATTLRARATALDGTPMSSVPLGDDVAALVDALRAVSGSAPNDSVLAALARAYEPGGTVGGAYVALMRAVLEPLGVAVLDASHPATREAGFHTLRRALLQSSDVERALNERTDAIRAAGFTPQVEQVPGLSLVFRYQPDDRKARVPVADARALVTKVRHGELGPNVLLRPVVERAILPTVAYVAGPGELAYFAQVRAVAQALGAAQPLAVPRWSGTVIEPGVRRALDRLGLTASDLADHHAVEARIAETRLPDGVRGVFDAMRAQLRAHAAALHAVGHAQLADAAAAAIVSVPTRAVDGAFASLAHRVDRLERRYVAAAKRVDDAAARDLAFARGSLYPTGTRQERALNAVPLLARYGDALTTAMLRNARRHARSVVDPPPTMRHGESGIGD